MKVIAATVGENGSISWQIDESLEIKHVIFSEMRNCNFTSKTVIFVDAFIMHV